MSKAEKIVKAGKVVGYALKTAAGIFLVRGGKGKAGVIGTIKSSKKK